METHSAGRPILPLLAERVIAAAVARDVFAQLEHAGIHRVGWEGSTGLLQQDGPDVYSFAAWYPDFTDLTITPPYFRLTNSNPSGPA